jgi:aryl-alcohol dehydrogenase-like predicted oxidoreductase
LIRELRRLGRVHGKTPAQVALAWLRRHRHVIPIPGAKRPAQAEENAGASGWSLSGREIRSLDGILRRVRLDTF